MGSTTARRETVVVWPVVASMRAARGQIAHQFQAHGLADGAAVDGNNGRAAGIFAAKDVEAGVVGDEGIPEPVRRKLCWPRSWPRKR